MNEPKELPGQKFNLAYFQKELCAFRQQMGQKSFWAKTEEQREAAKFAIGFVFLNLAADDGGPISSEDNERAANWWHSAIDEYGRREVTLLFSRL